MIKHIIWDWNGTLYDDAEYGRYVINEVLKHFDMPVLPDLTAYRRVFCFPVRTFYHRVGLTDAVYDEGAELWMKVYREKEHTVPLREHAESVVAALKQAGYTQAIVSASYLPALLSQVGQFPIVHILDDLCGLPDIHARSKVELAREYLSGKGYSPDETLFIGDSVHDAEVAGECGARCILVSGGHQNDQTLQTSGCDILEDLSKIPQWLKNHSQDTP